MGSTSPDRYDFIVVGAGAAGAVLASRLAKSKQHPSVLLVEAGGENSAKEFKADAERWIHRMNPPSNWSYKTTPIKGFDGKVLDYDRGKGLGGSTAINFSCWTIGPKDDHDRIAQLIGDEEWKWENAHERYKRLENYHYDVPAEFKKYLNPRAEDHGDKGPVKIGFPLVWEPSAKTMMDIWYENGIKFNPDHNDGDPVGLAINFATAVNGIRSTSADALVDAPSNLSVLTNSEVLRIKFEGKKAVAVETAEGREIYADKEIILSGGSLDSPRILLHSGIGPEDQLNKFNIPILKANDNVGQHLRDHHHVMLFYERAEHTSTRQVYYRSPELQATAREQWAKDGTGPLAEFATTLGIGYLKIDSLLDTAEFKDLPADEQDFLRKPTVPHYEVLLNGVHIPQLIDPVNATAGATFFVFNLNEQSEGEVTLQSSDPKVPLLFNPNFFSHPWDRRAAIEGTREVLKVIKSPAFQKDTVAVQLAPKSESDEDILEFWKQTSGSTWHMMGTTQFGKTENEGVVDKDFKVFGVDNLRVADMGVIPFAVNNHTQTTAYLVGLTAGDKLVAEYNLDD
ncbi:hypothetical protein LTR84_002233 [Exophiala bonariae]|uniref:Glucose-methanol-choline oxidoreductase N-terminal domain-containing protein n=1 Tax=Exophiala bonariae TaxID=1690606 RepID=A0AAV9NEE8_9EURO|nr:hypothetical protein LTR84_002233 [Exophiala bonariae]